ncbi:F-box domain-containing protein [Mycena sanguinolenta]|uniref:F-box domain-containing protein n=1 Tax=Mycena sanguinolenta TaxID=230812 RepID=A0A8H6YAM4_9AGAR|nr:F-box domain-containing protein [Mycena sanguinolenta]
MENVPLVAAGSSNPPYAPYCEKDTKATVKKYQSISCMPAYHGTSFEELRLQDYVQGRNGDVHLNPELLRVPPKRPISSAISPDYIVPSRAMLAVTPTGASVRAALLEQEKRTRNCSKAEIEQLIKECELETLSLESKISVLIELRISLETQICTLGELRDYQRARALALRYIVSPVHSLPVELLAEIFDLAIQDRTYIEDAHRISQVCSDWRRIAHSTPPLWARTLGIALCKTGKWNVADGLKAWLERSASLPISLRFAKGTGTTNPRILGEVLRVASRCRSLRMQATDILQLVPSWFLSQLSQCRLDSLEELDLIGKHDPFRVFGSLGALPNPPFFTAVPRLRKFSMYTFLPAPRVQNLIPWVQLTDLRVIDPHDIAFDILSQCPNLLTAAVTIRRWYHQDVIVLSQLHTLIFEFIPVGLTTHITPFFEHLSTPLLQTLCMRFGKGHWTQAHFMAFQLRAPNITHLEFGQPAFCSLHPEFTSDDLGAAIRHAPSLTHLTLDRCDNSFDDVLIHTLCYKDGVVPLAPRLHSLVVKSVKRNFTEDVLAGMIASRWWTDAELASVSPAVARWTHVKLKFGFGGQDCLGPRFRDIVKAIPSEILIYDKPVRAPYINDRI